VMCPLSNSTAYIGHPVRKCTKEHRHLICPIYRFDNQNLPLWWAPLHVHNGPVIAVCTVLGPNFESPETPELMCFPFSSPTFFFFSGGSGDHDHVRIFITLKYNVRSL
jgi:hypothetical protein